jgi:hypothetical protein
MVAEMSAQMNTASMGVARKSTAPTTEPGPP